MPHPLRITQRLLGAHCSTEGGVATAPEIGSKIGCTAIQLFTTSNRQWKQRRLTAADVDAFQKKMKSGPIKVAFAHAMYLINLAAPDSEVFRHSVQTMIGELQRADILGLPFVVIHPGSPKHKENKWGIYRIAEAISKVFEKTAAFKVKIALETTAGQGSQVGHRFEELALIMDVVGEKDRLGICFDTCHAFAAGYEIRTKEGYEKTWQEFDQIIGFEKLLAIHVNDSKGELGSRIDRHEHIGKGSIGLAGFKNFMNDRRLTSIPMVLETPKQEDAIKFDSQNLRTLLRLTNVI
jgi:deoxyribonuclease-4